MLVAVAVLVLTVAVAEELLEPAVGDVTTAVELAPEAADAEEPERVELIVPEELPPPEVDDCPREPETLNMED